MMWQKLLLLELTSNTDLLLPKRNIIATTTIPLGVKFAVRPKDGATGLIMEEIFECIENNDDC